jgi:hypothetical protein
MPFTPPSSALDNPVTCSDTLAGAVEDADFAGKADTRKIALHLQIDRAWRLSQNGSVVPK